LPVVPALPIMPALPVVPAFSCTCRACSTCRACRASLPACYLPAVCLSACLSVSLSVYLLVYLSVSPSVRFQFRGSNGTNGPDGNRQTSVCLPQSVTGNQK
jgi:hypothetical protein